VLGILSALFIKTVYRTDDLLERRFGERLNLRHGLGMFAVGVLIYLTMLLFGRYDIVGGGYYPVHDILSGSLSALSVLLGLFLLKFAATSIALGSGASGGVFFPALFLGAAAPSTTRTGSPTCPAEIRHPTSRPSRAWARRRTPII